MDQEIRYGPHLLNFSLPDGQLVALLEPRTPPPPGEPAGILARCLREPIGSRPLRELALGKRSAAILIPGKARRAATREYVPALVAELNEAGIPDRRIEVFLADGTHEQHLDGDVADLLGDELAARVRCLGHDPRDEAGLRAIGTTSFGTPVLINRRVLDAEVKVLTGRVVPHYFAGYSGGRKALIPGVAGFRTILANHRLTLDPHRGIHPGVGPGALAANPVHLDMVEGALLAQPVFCLNTLLDANHRLVAAVAGDCQDAHEEGCRLAERMCRLTIDEPVDLLITGAGGLPYDANFMQALKAVFNVQEVVRPGGAIVWVSECAGGIHPGFLRWAEIATDDELERAVRDDYALTAHNSLMLRRLTRRAEVALWSALPAEVVAKLGLHPLESLGDGLDWARRRFPRGFTYAVVPHANVVWAAPGRPPAGAQPGA